MAAIYLAPFYLLVCVYILLRSLHWFQVLHTVFRNVWVCRGIGLVYLFVVFSILIAFMAPASGFRRFMKLLSNYWLGVLMYTLMTLGIADGLRLLLKYPLRNLGFPGRELLFSNMGTAVVGAVCAVIISTVSIYGVLSAGNIHTTKYNISVDKKAGNMKELKVVLVADFHLGYNIGCKQMAQMNLEIVSRFLAGEVGKGVFATAHEGAAQYCRKVDKREIPVCPILGGNIAVINMNWLLKYLAQNIHQLQGDYICVSNVHTTVVSYEDADYRAVQNGGLMAIPDGNPLAQEARRRGYPQIQRTTGPDLMMEVFRQSAAHGWRHYFYGSTQEVQEKMIARLQQEYPGLIIAGTDAPPFRELTPEEDALAVARINQAQPDFVWVGLGAPKQERWMAAHQGRVHGLMIGVGAGFDFFSGNVRRAPLWMQKHSLEWLYRLMQDPKRLFQRYWSTNLKFIWNAAIRRK